MDEHPSIRPDPRQIAATLALVLIAPAALFFLAVIGRSLQPVEHEPARTLNSIAEAFLTLPPVLGLAAVVAAPLLAWALAAFVLWRTVTTDQALGQDVRRFAEAAVPLLRRPTLLVAIAVLVVAIAVTGVLFVHAVAG